MIKHLSVETNLTAKRILSEFYLKPLLPLSSGTVKRIDGPCDSSIVLYTAGNLQFEFSPTSPERRWGRQLALYVIVDQKTRVDVTEHPGPWIAVAEQAIRGLKLSAKLAREHEELVEQASMQSLLDRAASMFEQG